MCFGRNPRPPVAHPPTPTRGRGFWQAWSFEGSLPLAFTRKSRYGQHNHCEAINDQHRIFQRRLID